MSTSDSPYAQCRERHPYLARFRNDWATEAIAKQFLGNKRQHAYDMGWIDVPEKYTYLKENASKRNPTGSRKKTALQHVGGTSRKKNGSVSARDTARRELEEDEEEMLEFNQTSDEESSGSEEGDSAG